MIILLSGLAACIPVVLYAAYRYVRRAAIGMLCPPCTYDEALTRGQGSYEDMAYTDGGCS